MIKKNYQKGRENMVGGGTVNKEGETWENMTD